MGVNEIVNSVSSFFGEIGRQARVTGVVRTPEGWTAEAESVEEGDYMRKYGKDEIVGTYEVELDRLGEVVGFRRVSLRSRGSTEPPERLETIGAEVGRTADVMGESDSEALG